MRTPFETIRSIEHINFVPLRAIRSLPLSCGRNANVHARVDGHAFAERSECSLNKRSSKGLQADFSKKLAWACASPPVGPVSMAEKAGIAM